MAKRKHVAKAQPFYIEPLSVCIASVEYDGDGTLTVEFFKGGARVYDYGVSDDEAREAKAAARAGEAGEWFNDNLK